jgi:hypothetical protein
MASSSFHPFGSKHSFELDVYQVLIISLFLPSTGAISTRSDADEAHRKIGKSLARRVYSALFNLVDHPSGKIG